jgi:hypothetical protein
MMQFQRYVKNEHVTNKKQILIKKQLQKKFKLDLDDNEAALYIKSMINESVKAMLPQMVETIHRWAQNRRS